jgi:translocation protein SEC63
MLTKLPELIDGLIDIAFNRRWLETTFNIIRFSQCMVQGLWCTNHFLCQLPHFTDERVKELKTPPKSLTEYLRTPDTQKAGLAKLSEKDREDVLKACKLIPCVAVETVLVVEEDEGDEEADANGKVVYEEDLVTIKITMTRENVSEGSDASPVLAPRFPRLIKEGWWVVLTDKDRGQGAKRKGAEPAIMALEKITNQSRVIVHELRFMAPPKAGSYSLDLHILSDCYLGIDQVIDISFDVRPKSELPAYQPHQEDMELDNEPTFFEQVMAANVDDSSDDEDDDEGKDKKGRISQKKESSAVIEELSDDDE